MGLKSELKRFSNEHPLLSLMYIGFLGFTAIDLASSFTLPRGQGPFSGLGSYKPNYMTRSTLSAMEDDVSSLRRQIGDDTKVPDWAESKIYTAADRLDTVENYMSHRSNLGHITAKQQTKIDKIEGELRKASKLHAAQADRISQLGASTSTSTTTSSSHPPIVRERMQQHGGSVMSGLHGFGSMTKSQIRDKHPKGTKKGHIDRMHHHMQKGMEFWPAHDLATKEGFPAMGSIGFHHGVGHHCDSGVGFHHGVGEADSRQLPPGLRRRMMSRTYESTVSGAHLGKQDISVTDRANNNAMKNVSGIYGLSGILPETGGGWTE